jgi:putative sterol carrier protein
MSTFKDAEEVYDCLGKMFEIAVHDPQFVEATKGGDLVVRLTMTDPASTILIDFPGQKVTCGAAADGAPFTVELSMSADNSHKFWLGKLNLTLAMATKKAKMTGSRSKALKLLPLTKPLFATYEQLLQEAGRQDLLTPA